MSALQLTAVCQRFDIRYIWVIATYVHLPALNACNESRMNWALPHEKKTKHNILPFLLIDSPLKNANILKLFALFLIIACSPCQKTYLILSCVYVQAEVCMCYVESVVGLSPPWRLRWQSLNDKAKELPWKCCYYYLWSAGVSTFSFYQAISHRLALQWILFHIIICFTDTGQRYAFFPFVALSPNARRSHELCQLQMRLAVISRLKKFGTQHWRV